jgi:hypothetical protein
MFDSLQNVNSYPMIFAKMLFFDSLVRLCANLCRCTMVWWYTMVHHGVPWYTCRCSHTVLTEEPISMVDGSKRVFWRKEVPFGVWSKIGQNWGHGTLKPLILGPVKQLPLLKRILMNMKTMLDRRMFWWKTNRKVGPIFQNPPLW